MFKVGELVMYGGRGVCKICEIGKPDFAKEDDTLFYFLEPLYNSGIFYAPVDNEKISIRKVISKKEAKKLLDEVDSLKCESFTTHSIQQLSQHYQSIIDKHTCKDLLILTKSIMEKENDAIKHNKKLGQIDKRFMKKAEDLLYGEFAAALGIDIEEVENKVKTKLLEQLQT